MAKGHSSETISGEFETFSQLRSFAGEPVEFWPKYLRALISLAKAEGGGILIRGGGEDWKPIVVQPHGTKVLDGLERAERNARLRALLLSIWAWSPSNAAAEINLGD